MHAVFCKVIFYGKVLVNVLLELILHLYRHTAVSLFLLCLATQLTTVSLDLLAASVYLSVASYYIATFRV